MDNQLLLSICIPTNGVVEWVIPVVESIYAQNVDISLFEVVITDNGGKNDLKEALCQCNYPNFHYFQTTASGFMNQIDAFEKCSGVFCKMLNHRSRMLPGSINKLLELIDRYKDEKPIIYCAEGNAKGGELIECANVNEFVQSLSYWASWSAGTGVWKSDISDIRNREINKMFPHIVFLFGLRNESKYIIWNEKYEVMGDESGKGGYDLYHTFGVEFLDLLTRLRIEERITCLTFIKVKKDLFNFLKDLYLAEVILPTNHNFVLVDIPQSIGVYYGSCDYFRMIALAWIKMPKALIRRCLVKIWKFMF